MVQILTEYTDKFWQPRRNTSVLKSVFLHIVQNRGTLPLTSPSQRY